MYTKAIKPVLDIIIAIIALIILFPVFLLISIIIKMSSKGPVFFKQDRIGKNKRIFKCYKFRTMRIDTPKDVPTHMLENPEKYITKIGSLLRKTSLDELPQIINVAGGKMSIVGPRPALYNQDDLVEERDKYGANDIKPGITGLAQINGRDELEIPIKAKYDGEYAENQSFKFDVKIFFKTFLSILKKEGVREGKSSTDDNVESEEW